MKPDQHKKKRSAQYKKKHAIQKEKPADTAHKKGSKSRENESSNKLTSQSNGDHHDDNLVKCDDQGEKSYSSSKVGIHKVRFTL